MKSAIFICIALFIMACGGSKDTASSDDGLKSPDWQNEQLIWMEIEPIQCLGNPWEKDWINQEGRSAENYPTGNPRVIEAAEKEIIIKYYSSLGIDIVQVDSDPFPSNRAVCEACSCPQGYTLLIKVLESDARELLDLGFSRSSRL